VEAETGKDEEEDANRLESYYVDIMLAAGAYRGKRHGHLELQRAFGAANYALFTTKATALTACQAEKLGAKLWDIVMANLTMLEQAHGLPAEPAVAHVYCDKGTGEHADSWALIGGKWASIGALGLLAWWMLRARKRKGASGGGGGGGGGGGRGGGGAHAAAAALLAEENAASAAARRPDRAAAAAAARRAARHPKPDARVEAAGAALLAGQPASAAAAQATAAAGATRKAAPQTAPQAGLRQRGGRGVAPAVAAVTPPPSPDGSGGGARPAAGDDASAGEAWHGDTAAPDSPAAHLPASLLASAAAPASLVASATAATSGALRRWARAGRLAAGRAVWSAYAWALQELQVALARHAAAVQLRLGTDEAGLGGDGSADVDGVVAATAADDAVAVVAAIPRAAASRHDAGEQHVAAAAEVPTSPPPSRVGVGGAGELAVVRVSPQPAAAAAPVTPAVPGALAAEAGDAREVEAPEFLFVTSEPHWRDDEAGSGGAGDSGGSGERL
jgi:hypothetical protein